MASRAWRASRQVQQSVWRSVRDPGSIVPRRFTSTPGDARSSLLPSFGLRTRAFSTEEKLPDAASQVVMLSDEEDEDDDLEEENLPPWRQLKPWRWQPPEEDLGWLKIFQLPKVQVDEAGRSYIIGFYATGICIFFTFVWWGNPGSAFVSSRTSDASAA
ncbi:Potassium channel AKT2/3 [Durusdinium trenchii]|uniref:Potassium channel AKT2/3 n=1 Tax=Durusdinium trenchii TaxID=1381693 RepID=A0ABP0M7I2_9DINO